jgi:hypothetical protein
MAPGNLAGLLDSDVLLHASSSPLDIVLSLDRVWIIDWPGLACSWRGVHRRGIASGPGDGRGAPGLDNLGVVRAGHFGSDSLDDLVGFVLGDLDEVVRQVATLGGDE